MNLTMTSALCLVAIRSWWRRYTIRTRDTLPPLVVHYNRVENQGRDGTVSYTYEGRTRILAWGSHVHRIVRVTNVPWGAGSAN